MELLNRLQAVFARTSAGSKIAPGDRELAGTQNVQAKNRRKKPRIDARKGTRVLIIDDSPTVQSTLRRVLGKAGYVPFVAASAERGLEIAHTEQPDLVMLDILLPGMNGFTALRNIRRDPGMQHLPVIMMSGNKQSSEQIYVMHIGADGFISKPISRFDLFSRIEKILDNNLVPRRTSKSAIRQSVSRTNHLMNRN